MWGKISRPFFLALGYVSLALGIIGLLLPVLPTTPFILLAAFAFSKSSEKLHGWLLNHRLYGPLITNWQRHGVIRPRAKWTSVSLIVILAGPSIYLLSAPVYAKVLLFAICACVVCFITTRPGVIPEESVPTEEGGTADRRD